MLQKGTEPSSRRCGSQPVSKPNRYARIDPVWISIMIGASSGRDHHFEQCRDEQARDAAETRGAFPDRRIATIEPEQFRREQNPHREFEQLQRAFGVETRPRRETA